MKTEILPGQQQLWLQHKDSSKHCHDIGIDITNQMKGSVALWLEYCSGRRKPTSSVCDKTQCGNKVQSFPHATPKLQPRKVVGAEKLDGSSST